MVRENDARYEQCGVCGRLNARADGSARSETHDSVPHALHDRIEALEKRVVLIAEAIRVIGLSVEKALRDAVEREQRCSDLERVVAATSEWSAGEPALTIVRPQARWWSRVVEGKPIRFVFSSENVTLNVSVEPREP